MSESNRYQVAYTMNCFFVDKENSERVYYSRALVRCDYDGGVNYQIVKCSKEFAENFKDFGVTGTPFFDLRGRLVQFIIS